MATSSEKPPSSDTTISPTQPTPNLPSTLSLDSSEQTSSSTTEPEAFNPGWRFVAAFLSLCIIVLMAALDATSLSVALPVSSQIHILLTTHTYTYT